MSTTKSTVLVKHHLKSLKLPTMSNECEKVASRAAVENLDHLAYLQRLCELELIERERRAAERRLKAARFPQTKTLDEFDFGQQPSINKPLVLELAKGQYIDDRENVLLIGSSGVGKTHLAIALGLAACGQGRKVRFFRVTELITLLMEAKEEKQLLRFRKQIKQLDLIVLDELGYVPTGKVGAELLFDVLSTAYERQSLIVTTNLPFEQWTEVLGSERLTGAALDRLTHRCHILEAKAKASGSGTPADGSGEQPARPEPAILGATSYPGVDSTHPQRCTFRPPRAALFNRRSHQLAAADLFERQVRRDHSPKRGIVAVADNQLSIGGRRPDSPGKNRIIEASDGLRRAVDIEDGRTRSLEDKIPA